MDLPTKESLKERLNARDEFIRESWIRAMEVKLVREELKKCNRAEGVNHLENCKVFADAYIDLLKENKVKGYKHIDT